MRTYSVRRATVTPELQGFWDGAAWGQAPTVDIDHFHERSSDHRPVTQAKMVYDDQNIYLIFRVQDRFVRAVQTAVNSSVCRDSCAEFFFEPVANSGYFNIEINCGGTLLLHYNERTGEGGYRAVEFNAAQAAQVRIHHSLPQIVDPEIQKPTTWLIEYACPVALFEPFVGPLKPLAGATWRANFYKCGDQTSKPHWGMWNPVLGPLSFHKPQYFAPITFEHAITNS